MTVPALDLLRDYISYMSVRFTPDEWDEICRALDELEAQQALLADAIAYVRRNVGTDTPTSVEADLLAR